MTKHDQRKIIHVDMDAFYAAVETLDNPALASSPVIIGGSPSSRSVVCTANYIARQYGVKSAMACSVAARLCPAAIFLRPRFERYKEVSCAIRKIFADYTSLIEPLSLDEAYLDVTDNTSGLYATQIAKIVKDRVFQETGLTCSAGVAPNKLIAKIASDFNKPNGITVVTPENARLFMERLPIRKIYGIGPATEKKLNHLGVFICSDVLKFDLIQLKSAVGSWAPWLFDAAQGIDFRPVQPSRERKSYGCEETFSKDISNLSELENELSNITKKIIQLIEKKNLRAKTITLKIKYFDFKSITRAATLNQASAAYAPIFDTLKSMLNSKTDAGRIPVRLLGASVSNLEPLKDAITAP